MQNYPQYGSNYSRVPAGCTLKEYRKNYISEALKKRIKTDSIVGYVLVGINVAIGLTLNVFALVDAALFLALILGVHLGKNKGCAIGLMGYAVFGTAVNLISYGKLTGWMWLVLGWSYLRTFKQIDEEYKTEMAKLNGGYVEL